MCDLPPWAWADVLAFGTFLAVVWFVTLLALNAGYF